MAEALPGGPSSRDIWIDMNRLTEVNSRANHTSYWTLFPKESYQINPYTKTTLTYVTGKVGEKPPVPEYRSIAGYDRIKCLYDKAYTTPMNKFNQGGPETENQRFGWFTKRYDEEDYDERFVYAHRTPDFIKTQMLIKAYDQMMSGLVQSKSEK